MTNPGNWRSISQTCIFAKLLEKIVHSDLLNYLTVNRIMSEYQYGFLPNRSTQEAVFELSKTMYSAINNRKVMGLIFLDVAKAFNCIHHERLYNKMYKIGCADRVIAWMRSYLCRTQIVNVNTKKSNKIMVCSGIAQGTVLGPLMFILYINDIIKSISNCNISMFADVCILYYVGNTFDPMYRRIQSDVNSFIEWCSTNGLKINSGKTKAMIVSTNTRLNNLCNKDSFTIQGENIHYVSQYNYLGLVLDNEMSLFPLYKNIKKRVNNNMFVLRKIRKYLTEEAAIMVYKQTILPIFDYGGFLLISLNNSGKYELQVVQNDALRFCENIHLLDKISIPKIHDSVRLLSLEQRRQKQVLNLMFNQARKGKSRSVTNVNTRSQAKYVFKTDVKIGKKYEKSPFFLGTILWNALNKETQDLPCRYAFKRKIDSMYKKYCPLI